MTKTLHPTRILGLLLFFAATKAFAGCGMWQVCCPDGKPPAGEFCSPCQMSKSCGSGNTAPKKTSAGSCVRQTLVGAVNVWEYTNTCDRTVEARITRRCDASDSATAGKKKSVALMFSPRQTLKFDRSKHFGGFCEVLAGNTNSEYVESQSFRD